MEFHGLRPYYADPVEKGQQDDDAVDHVDHRERPAQLCRGCKVAVTDGGQADDAEVERVEIGPAFQPVIDQGTRQQRYQRPDKHGSGVTIAQHVKQEEVANRMIDYDFLLHALDSRCRFGGFHRSHLHGYCSNMSSVVTL